jgi:hypothetical protein
MKYYRKIFFQDNLLKDKMHRKLITYAELAKRLGYKSTGAVDRALNGRAIISEKQYLRIKEAIESL